MRLCFNQGGSGDRLFVLVHGLGCTSDVWQGLSDLIEHDKAGRWIAPDLRGHGRSSWRDSYAAGHHAADVASLIQDEEDVILIGHSMGALIAIILATGMFGIKPRAMLGLGLKCDWPKEEQEKLLAFAQKPIRWFENDEEAINRYLIVSGLDGLLDPSSPDLQTAIYQGEMGFRLAADPKTVTVGGPPSGIFESAKNTTPVRLACGEHDTVTSLEELRKMDPDAVLLEGLGHNCHVEDPAAVWQLVANFTSAASR